MGPHVPSPRPCLTAYRIGSVSFPLPILHPDAGDQWFHDVDIACVRALSGVAVAYWRSDGQPGIAVGTIFFWLSIPTRKAILLHEMGHLAWHRFDRDTSQIRARLTRDGIIEGHEDEADLFAVTYIGAAAMVDCLAELRRHLPTAAAEIDLRIRRLSELIHP